MKRTEQTQKWLDALRSEEYPQTRKTLRDHKGYCCLGVAGALVDLPVHLDTDLIYDWIDKFYGIERGERFSLAEMNDNQRMTFAEIADAIEGMIEQ
jgi:hypothetical protein